MNNNNEIFENAPVGKAVARMAVPTIISMLVVVIYNMADTFFIGQTGDAMQVAAVSISAPVFTILMAFGNLFGIGGSSAIARALGEKKLERAKQISAFCCYASIGIGVFIMIFCLLGMSEILGMIGASENTVDFAREYVTIIAMSGPFIIFSFAFCNILRGEGASRQAMVGNMIGTVTNIVLDPVFIFVFDMGVAGAAFATVLSQFASAVFVLRFLRGNRVLLRLEFECPQVKTVCKIALMGLSPFLIIAFDNVLIISLNTVIQMYGGAEADMLLTCTTIVQSFMLIVTMPLGGITSGTGAILGFNFGAGRPDRIRSAQKYITLLAVVQCSIMFLFSRTLAQYFVYLFTRNESYVELTVWAIRVYTMGIIPLAVQYEVVDGFTGMGVPSVAISLSMFRKLLYLVSVFLIPVFAGVENVFYAEVVSDFGGTTVSVIVYLLLIGRIMGRCVERAKWNGNSDNTVINQ